MADVTQPIAGPAFTPAGPTPVAAPRLARHTFTLSDGHRIGLAVSGRGVPLVVVHGFTAEGFLYAQTLSRLVTKGFAVVAIDMAGHGGTQGLPTRGLQLSAYADLLTHMQGVTSERFYVVMPAPTADPNAAPDYTKSVAPGSFSEFKLNMDPE